MDELSGYECKNYRFMVRKRLASGGGQQIPIFLLLVQNAPCWIIPVSNAGVKEKLPFHPLKNPKQYEDSIKNNWGIQFSHTLEEQIGGK